LPRCIALDRAPGRVRGGVRNAGQAEGAAVNPGGMAALVVQEYRRLAAYRVQVCGGGKSPVRPQILGPAATLQPFTLLQLAGGKSDPADGFCFGGHFEKIQAL
jgi:hypothetical protein